ncbi:site-specific integrase [Ramlibacter sp. 2FC]|uniref:tyrosine-type recombinase/integrase n=1 Tax=Ramlibacter sp. 2FC TaxID=2502188 RepID=UPI0010F7C557|nr:site-specific integrase [Ramlibacter sp. 2FC]
MALHQLTDRAVKTAKPMDKERLIADGGGLFLRVLPTGFKSWLLVYSFDGKRSKLALGSATDVSLAAARETAAHERARIAAGADPRVALMEREAEQAAQREALIAAEIQRKREASTLQDMFDAWIADGVQRADGNAELRRTFEKDILPKLGKQPVRLITDTELRDALRKVGRVRGRGRTAERMLVEVRQMYRWAIKRQPWKALLVDGNPAELVETKQVVPTGYEPVIRERILQPAEIRELRNIFATTQEQYEAADNRRSADRPLQHETQLALWLCLGTACRIGELLMARWEHVDLDAGTWFVPRENTKTRVDWQVYLSDFALRHFKALHEITGTGDDKSEWCFPARHQKGHINVKTVSKQVGDRQMRFKNRKPLKNRRNDDTLVLSKGENGEWTPHDLRRTAATMMQALGVGLDVIDRCQNHVMPGSKVRRHYMHHDYADEKRDAWRKLGERIDAILAEA